ncbi:uncharacterized protein LOC128199664 [Bicyclus anynana]|uniref:Uncharacterized protein LOC128199664 n=1 Tax=Bicyclus anynana TaxID=110368 RepID=A0ABM3M3K6_BICAN|nr:uncharacterized protein LOC128199664 [Bicyclus anynana]
MLFYLILIICVIQNASPVSNKRKIEIQSRPFNRQYIENYNKFQPQESSELSSESRRIFKWIKNLLYKNTTNITKSSTQSNSVTQSITYNSSRIPDHEIPQTKPTYEEVLNERIRFRKIERNLTETLDKLSRILNQILNIVKYTRYQNFHDLHAYLPAKFGNKNRRDKRFKRDVNGTGVLNMKRDDEKNKNDAEKSELIEKIETKLENTTTAENRDVPKPDIAHNRRSMLPVRTNDEVKNRLFKYIDEAFADIAKKIDSLKDTKRMFSKDVSYRVGYIISNIDTLQVNMMNMKLEMDKNKYVWDDRKILNLYDTVKISNQAITDLLDILKVYVDKSVN